MQPTPTVKIVTLPLHCKNGDLEDWIDEHGEAAEPDDLRQQLEALVDAALPQPAAAVITEATLATWAAHPDHYRPFPVSVLPSPVKEYVAASAQAIGCDPGLVAPPLLSSLAAAIGATRRIELKPDWIEPSVLWTATVGESGSYKSPGLDAGTCFLDKLQQEKFSEHADALPDYDAAVARYEQAYVKWKHKAPLHASHNPANANGLPPSTSCR